MPAPGRLVLIAPLALLLVVSAGCANRANAADDSKDGGERGFTRLFNGKDTSGWIYGTTKGVENKVGAGYQVNPETQALYTTAHDGGNLYTEKQYSNFIIRFEFKLAPGGNN